MRSIAFAFLLAFSPAGYADAQSYMSPGDLDHVLGAALALTMDAADALEGVLPPSAGGTVDSPATLRRAQRRSFFAALAANRAQSYLRLYVIHLAEHREAVDEPPPQWSALMVALDDVPALFEGLLETEAEIIGRQPLDAAAWRDRFQVLAGRLRAVAEQIGEEPARYED